MKYTDVTKQFKQRRIDTLTSETKNMTWNVQKSIQKKIDLSIQVNKKGL